MSKILLTGATGFVGGNLWPALETAGHSVRGLTRDVDRARKEWPDREWVCGDVETGDGLADALNGCDAVYYLVHGMGRGGADYRNRDRDAARRFGATASGAGVTRIIYLGGVEPQGPPSEHLASRLEVGQVLREGPVPTLELRASMIIGCGSLSWIIVRDLAARLPAMIIPKWLERHTEPVAVEDVLAALVRGLDVPLERSASYDLPGPQALTEREIIVQSAEAMGLQPPIMIPVPTLTPWLSSHWIHFVTRAEWDVAREIVLGLQYDLLARDHNYWKLIGHTNLVPFEQAAEKALSDEHREWPPKTFSGRVERAVRRVHGVH